MKLLLALVFSNIVFAAGGEYHGGHLSDLLVPAINFTIVFGFMAWKIIPFMKNSFVEKADSIKDLVEYAAEKDAKAEKVLSASKAKLDNIEGEKEQIITNAKKDGDKFEETYVQEIKASMEKMEVDSSHKLESEKKMMLKQLNESLLDEVISKTKNKIHSDSSLSNKATSNLISRL
ncbi:ATP synthase F0 subunit B [Halobacteriovorax sp. HFRX-2_2]|uniref:F0F1 ATP synthase subunit B family protein n=1 Tax=unclassified Halobacteriovorax TaxID=2639665 RepID=UPI0037187297